MVEILVEDVLSGMSQGIKEEVAQEAKRKFIQKTGISFVDVLVVGSGLLIIVTGVAVALTVTSIVGIVIGLAAATAALFGVIMLVGKAKDLATAEIIRDTQQIGADMVAGIQADPNLSPEQKEAIIKIILENTAAAVEAAGGSSSQTNFTAIALAIGAVFVLSRLSK